MFLGSIASFSVLALTLLAPGAEAELFGLNFFVGRQWETTQGVHITKVGSKLTLKEPASVPHDIPCDQILYSAQRPIRKKYGGCSILVRCRDREEPNPDLQLKKYPCRIDGRRHLTNCKSKSIGVIDRCNEHWEPIKGTATETELESPEYWTNCHIGDGIVPAKVTLLSPQGATPVMTKKIERLYPEDEVPEQQIPCQSLLDRSRMYQWSKKSKTVCKTDMSCYSPGSGTGKDSITCRISDLRLAGCFDPKLYQYSDHPTKSLPDCDEDLERGTTTDIEDCNEDTTENPGWGEGRYQVQVRNRKAYGSELSNQLLVVTESGRAGYTSLIERATEDDKRNGRPKCDILPQRGVVDATNGCQAAIGCEMSEKMSQEIAEAGFESYACLIISMGVSVHKVIQCGPEAIPGMPWCLH